MRKITRMVLISAVLVTSGLTAKIAHENYKAMITNDERIHKAYELAKKPNKAAVLEAIVDATNAETDERIQKAVVIEAEEPKVVRIKTKVTTSAGVSPIASVMDKTTVNKAEEFIEKVTHPAEAVMMTNRLDFTSENIPTQELTYEIKDIFPEFGEGEKETLTYKINLPKTTSWTDPWDPSVLNYFFEVNEDGTSDGSKPNCITINSNSGLIFAFKIIKNPSFRQVGANVKHGVWNNFRNDSNTVKFYLETRTIDYRDLVQFRDSDERTDGAVGNLAAPTHKEVYDFLVGVEKEEYKLLKKDGAGYLK